MLHAPIVYPSDMFQLWTAVVLDQAASVALAPAACPPHRVSQVCIQLAQQQYHYHHHHHQIHQPLTSAKLTSRTSLLPSTSGQLCSRCRCRWLTGPPWYSCRVLKLSAHDMLWGQLMNACRLCSAQPGKCCPEACSMV